MTGTPDMRSPVPVLAMNVNELEFHPIANAFPLVDGQAFEELTADIKRNGLLNLSSGSATEFSIVSQSLAMRSENRCCLHLYARELDAFCADFT